MLKTGREVQAKIISSDFCSQALDFANNKERSFDSQEEALEFLACYLVLLTTAEYREYNETKLIKNYHRIRSILKKERKIYDREFLSTTFKGHWFYLQNETCLIE